MLMPTSRVRSLSSVCVPSPHVQRLGVGLGGGIGSGSGFGGGRGGGGRGGGSGGGGGEGRNGGGAGQTGRRRRSIHWETSCDGVKAPHPTSWPRVTMVIVLLSSVRSSVCAHMPR